VTDCWNRMQRKNSIHRISAYSILPLQQWESFSGVLECAFSQFADSDISPSLRIQMWGTHWEAQTHVCWIDSLSFTRVERIVKEPILPPLEINPNYKKCSLDHTEQIWIHF
jgi:hypothetical protein